MRKPVWSSFNAPLEGVDCFHRRGFQAISARIQGMFLHDPAAGRPRTWTIPSTMREAQERVGDFYRPAPLEPRNANHPHSLCGLAVGKARTSEMRRRGYRLMAQRIPRASALPASEAADKSRPLDFPQRPGRPS